MLQIAMEGAYKSLKLSARGHSRILKMGRTIADLAGDGEIKIEQLAEAVNYRPLDRKYWGEAGVSECALFVTISKIT